MAVLRMDTTGADTLHIAIPFAGDGYYAATIVHSGVYQLTYTPPAGFDLLAGDANPKMTPVGGSIVWVRFNVGPLSGP